MTKKTGEEEYFFYNHHQNLDSAVTAISTYLAKKYGSQALIAGLNLKKPVQKIFRYLPDKFKIKIHENNPSVYKLEINKIVKWKGKERIEKAKCLLLKIADDFIIVVSIEGLSSFHSIILQCLSYYNLELSRSYLDSNSLRTILDNLRKNNCTISAKRIIALERELSEEGQLIKKSDIIYTNEDYREAFQTAIDRDQFIDKIDIKIRKGKDENETVFNSHLSRQGIFRIDTNFSFFFETILQDYKNMSVTKFSLLCDRARTRERNFVVKPLEIKYGVKIFSDVANNKRLIQAIKTMKYLSISGYHSNPYINLSVLDYLDGSSLDLWVYCEDSIVLVPQSKCTPDFLSRFINHVFENFREGTVEAFDGDTGA